MASPLDLVSLAEAQAYLGASATGNSVKLAVLITAVSLAIDRATDATILPRTYTEIRDGNPRGIMLRNWPVISVASVTSQAPGFGGATTLVPLANGGAPFGGGYGFTIDIPNDPQASTPQMLRAPYGGLPKGVANVTIVYAAGYQVTGETATVPQPSAPSMTAAVTVMQPQGAWGSDQGVSYAAGGPLTAVTAGSEAKGAYSVAGGVYTFSAADAGMSVAISYGYVPADLANACLEWIADRLAYQDRIGIASKSLGGQETVSYRIGATPAFVTSILQPYTNVVPIT